MGEMDFERKVLVKALDSGLRDVEQAVAEMRVATPGGQFQVRWDEGGSATALEQLAFFAEFLEVSGLFARWRDGCPMAYTSPNAPAVVDILGTDSSVKVLYGLQAGVEIGYNPSKPGTTQPYPAHVLDRQPAPGARCPDD